jgi:hypothetical protein
MSKDQKPFDPLDPAEWTPNRGLLATNPVSIVFAAACLIGIFMCVVSAIIGVLS